MKYTIFNKILESDIPLPELQSQPGKTGTIFFQSRNISDISIPSITWCHHWYHSNGQISISVGKEGYHYWIRFPNIADYRIDPVNYHIISYRHQNTRHNTVRHLLLDQVIPRILTHHGEPILHASCIKIGNSAVAFAGESGWGKSTLAAFFYRKGHIIMTDDCILLETKNATISGIPNYQGLRLLQDTSLFFANETDSPTVPVAHYGSKKRLIISHPHSNKPIPLKAIFILTNPTLTKKTTSSSIQRITGATAAIALVKNSFPIDVTDKKRMGKQLQNMATIAGSKDLSIYQLNYSRRMASLSETYNMIKKTLLMDKR